MSKWNVFGIHYHHPLHMDGVTAVQADLTRQSDMEKLFESIRPQAVVHAAAVSQPGYCEAHPQTTNYINVEAPRGLAILCAQRNIPFVFTSTDLVFDGLKAPYSERAAVSPVCVYGEQKVRAERAVLQGYGGSLVCRLPLMIGVGPRASSSFCMQMLSAIQQGKPLRLFEDEFRTPVGVAIPTWFGN